MKGDSKVNVLIVDDEYYIVQGCEKAIRQSVPDVDLVFLAYSAKQARAILLKEKVDLLLTDIEMPMENGLELIAWMREQKMDTKIIILTGHQRFDYAKRAMELRVYNYLVKPVDKMILKQEFEAVIEEMKRYGNQKEALGDPFTEKDTGKETATADSKRLAQSIRKYIMEHLSDPNLSREDLAQEVHLTPEYFSVVFRKLFGSTLTEYILTVRIDHSCDLLMNTNLSIDDIAHDSGFANTSYFFKKFKDTKGVTPKKYRAL